MKSLEPAVRLSSSCVLEGGGILGVFLNLLFAETILRLDLKCPLNAGALPSATFEATECCTISYV